MDIIVNILSLIFVIVVFAFLVKFINKCKFEKLSISVSIGFIVMMIFMYLLKNLNLLQPESNMWFDIVKGFNIILAYLGIVFNKTPKHSNVVGEIEKVGDKYVLKMAEEDAILFQIQNKKVETPSDFVCVDSEKSSDEIENK